MKQGIYTKFLSENVDEQDELQVHIFATCKSAEESSTLMWQPPVATLVWSASACLICNWGSYYIDSPARKVSDKPYSCSTVWSQPPLLAPCYITLLQSDYSHPKLLSFQNPLLIPAFIYLFAFFLLQPLRQANAQSPFWWHRPSVWSPWLPPTPSSPRHRQGDTFWKLLPARLPKK